MASILLNEALGTRILFSSSTNRGCKKRHSNPPGSSHSPKKYTLVKTGTKASLVRSPDVGRTEALNYVTSAHEDPGETHPPAPPSSTSLHSSRDAVTWRGFLPSDKKQKRLGSLCTHGLNEVTVKKVRDDLCFS